MRKNLRNKTLSFLCVGVVACTGVGFLLGASEPQPKPIKGAEKIEYQSALYNWRLVGTPYTIENYSSSVRVFDPNGALVDVSSSGKITLTIAGEYVIVYPSKTERLSALLTAPVSELALSGELDESYPAGTILTLPALDVENETYEFAYYYVDVLLNAQTLETLKVEEGEETVYLLQKDGEYEFSYYVLNDRGTKESVSISTVSKKQKAILADELPTSLQVGETLIIGWPYAYYDGVVYDVSVSLRKDGQTTALKGQTFIPENAGEYTIIYTAQILGESITQENTFTAYAPEEELFRAVDGEGMQVGVQELPSWNTNTAYTEGLLLKGSNETTKFSYTQIVDLSTLTKEDNLLVFLPYSSVEEEAYMDALRITLTDIHDTNRKVSMYFFGDARLMGNPNVPSSYATVEIAGNKFGIENTQKYGTLMSGSGTIACNSSFKGAYNNKSDVFSVQYDFLSEILYLTTERNPISYPMQQYVYLPLSGKGELPQGVARLPERYWFEGFTTGEVYMDIEMIGNKNAGVYLCEVAGKKASELTADFEENFLIFDQSVKQLPTGAVNYEYTLPTAHLNKKFEGTAKILSSVKDMDGNPVTLKNGKFTPMTAGTYQAIYTTNYYGMQFERVYEFIIAQEPMDIDVEVEVDSPVFGGMMPVPTVSVSGGNGALSYTYKVLLGEKEISLNKDGKYLIDKEGTLKVVVTASDVTGYVKVEEFEVEILDGVLFSMQTTMPSAVRIGWPTAVPMATVTTYTNGVYTTQNAEIKAYENGVENVMENGRITVSATTSELRFEYSYEYNGAVQRQSFDVEVLPEEIFSVTEYLLTNGAVETGMTEKGILLTVTGDATIRMPHAVAAEGLLLTVGFHKENMDVDGWEIVLRDIKTSSAALKLGFTAFDSEKGTASLTLNGGTVQTISGRVNAYTQSCGDAETVEKYAGKEYVLFSIFLNSAKSILTDYETGKTLFTVSTFESGTPFSGFEGNACLVEMSVSKSSTQASDLLISQISNQYFNYGEDTFGYFDADGIAPVIVIDGDKTSRSVSYGYELTVPAAAAYDVLGGVFSVKVRIMANGEEVLSSRDASKPFTFVLDEYKAYAVVYETTDFSGNRVQAYFNLTVIDEEKPTLTIDGKYATNVKLGTKVTILPFTATDGQGGVETVVFIKDDQAKLTFVKVGSTYTFEKNGRYEIVYRSVDEAGNITRQSFTVVVE